LKPYWGKLTVRNFREGLGNNGIIRSPFSAKTLLDPAPTILLPSQPDYYLLV
jgi:hypothetical protein